jgi:hypothetical protein
MRSVASLRMTDYIAVPDRSVLGIDVQNAICYHDESVPEVNPQGAHVAEHPIR